MDNGKLSSTSFAVVKVSGGGEGGFNQQGWGPTNGGALIFSVIKLQKQSKYFRHTTVLPHTGRKCIETKNLSCISDVRITEVFSTSLLQAK